MNDPIRSREADDAARMVTVCDACLRASCWLYEFCCDRYKEAGITQRSVAELRRLNLEHSDYWKPERAYG